MYIYVNITFTVDYEVVRQNYFDTIIINFNFHNYDTANYNSIDKASTPFPIVISDWLCCSYVHTIKLRRIIDK